MKEVLRSCELLSVRFEVGEFSFGGLSERHRIGLDFIRDRVQYPSEVWVVGMLS